MSKPFSSRSVAQELITPKDGEAKILPPEGGKKPESARKEMRYDCDICEGSNHWLHYTKGGHCGECHQNQCEKCRVDHMPTFCFGCLVPLCGNCMVEYQCDNCELSFCTTCAEQGGLVNCEGDLKCELRDTDFCPSCFKILGGHSCVQGSYCATCFTAGSSRSNCPHIKILPSAPKKKKKS